MPEDEGLLLHRYALRQAPQGPLLEVGTYCGKSAIYLGAAAREVGGDRLHRRPPPRLGGEPGRVGAPRHRASSTRGPAGWTRCRSSGAPSRTPAWRTRSSPSSGRRPRSPATGVRRWRCCSSTAGTAQSPPTPTTPAGCRWLMAGGLLVIHDVFPDPADGGRPPYQQIYRPRARERRLHRGGGAGLDARAGADVRRRGRPGRLTRSRTRARSPRSRRPGSCRA